VLFWGDVLPRKNKFLMAPIGAHRSRLVELGRGSRSREGRFYLRQGAAVTRRQGVPAGAFAGIGVMEWWGHGVVECSAATLFGGKKFLNLGMVRNGSECFGMVGIGSRSGGAQGQGLEGVSKITAK